MRVACVGVCLSINVFGEIYQNEGLDGCASVEILPLSSLHKNRVSPAAVATTAAVLVPSLCSCRGKKSSYFTC